MKTQRHLIVLKLLIVLLQPMSIGKCYAERGSRFGFHVSPNMASGISVITANELNAIAVLPLAGITVGHITQGELNLGCSRDITLSSGLNLAYRGFKVWVGGDMDAVEMKTAFTSVEFPMTLSTRSMIAEGIYFKQSLGVIAAYTVGFNGGNADLTSSDSRSTTTINYRSDLNTMFSGNLVCGLSLEFKYRNGSLLDLGMSYNHGLVQTLSGKLMYSEKFRVDNAHNEDSSTQYDISYRSGYIAVDVVYFLPEKTRRMIDYPYFH